MKLRAVLTVGWNDDPNHPCSALRLHQEASTAKLEYETALGKALDAHSAAELYGLGRLFRRRAKGFQKLKQFVGALVALPSRNQDGLQCHIDVFAYAFLKSAKNFDLLIPEATRADSSFRRAYPSWRKIITALEEFERMGEPLPQGMGIRKEDYLRIRRVITRKTARDERRALTTLLVSGPSTREELSADMGLNYPLAQRVLGAFVTTGVVELSDGNTYTIVETALPLVVFCLRETIGIDLLSSVQTEED